MHPHFFRGVLTTFAVSVTLTLSTAPSALTAGVRSTASTAIAKSSDPDPLADWPSYNRDLQNDRFSPLALISRANVGRLHPICTAAVGQDIGFETGPIVVDGVLYATTIHTTYAFDATNCRPLWQSPTNYATDTGLANRGAVYAGGKIFRGTIGNHVLALDAHTGQTVWDKQLAKAPAFITAAPIAWRGVVFIGLAGADVGGQGALFALDANTGNVLWSAPTVPADPLSGTLPISSGWGGASHVAGGSTWSSYTLDPLRGLLLVSTGNPAPDFFGPSRLGDNPSTDALLVYNATNGKLLEQHQFVRHDVHDWDIAASAAYLAPSATAFVAGKDGLLRRVQLGVAKAVWTRKVTTVDDNPALPVVGQPVHFCPGTTGGVEWNGPAYSPRQNSVIVNSVDWCNTLTLDAAVTTSDITNSTFGAVPVFYIPGAPWVGTTNYSSQTPNAPFGVPDSQRFGHVTAVNANTGALLWQFNASSPMIAGVTPTAGDLVFSADLNGNFFAFDSRNGAVLKEIALNQPVAGGVITYTARSNQYVAIAAGMTSPQVWSTIGTNEIVVLGL